MNDDWFSKTLYVAADLKRIRSSKVFDCEYSCDGWETHKSHGDQSIHCAPSLMLVR